MWLSDLFYRSACGQILQRNPGRGQTPPLSWQCLYFGSFWSGNPSLRPLRLVQKKAFASVLYMPRHVRVCPISFLKKVFLWNTLPPTHPLSPTQSPAQGPPQGSPTPGVLVLVQDLLKGHLSLFMQVRRLKVAVMGLEKSKMLCYFFFQIYIPTINVQKS